MEDIISKLFLLEPAFKYYDWGSASSIQEITGRKELGGKTAAEMWMGDHASGPNMVKTGNSLIPFHRLLESEPEKILGRNAVSRFGKTLPFLFKLLASSKPLSIQAHPSRKQAEEGYERENILEISLDDFTRGYKDRNHKPEIMLAVTDFTMMKGFRKYSIITENFRKYCPSSSHQLFSSTSEYPEEKKIKSFFRNIMSASISEIRRMTEESISSAVRDENRNSLVSQLITRFSGYHPDDAGILSPLYLNCDVLERGEAVYIPSGELHAYVEGTGMELMANSDNVFRGGLTSKHIDREELFRILDYSPGEIKRVEKKVTGNEIFYPADSEEFLISEIDVSREKSYISPDERNLDIVFCLSGNASVSKKDSENEKIDIVKGDSFAAPSCAGSYSITGEGVFYKATVPL